MEDQSLAVEKKSIHPFKVHQAILALELGKIDEDLLQYFNSLCQQLAVHRAYCIHVVPEIAHLMDIFQKEAHQIIGGYSFDERVLLALEEEVRNTINCEGLQLSYEIKEGKPMLEIIKAAQERTADLIMIGQRNDTDEHGIFANKLVRHSECNAWVVPQGAACRFDNLLVPIDFSPNSVRAFQTALGIKKQIGEKCNIHCLHIYSLPNLSSFKLNRPWVQFKNIVESNINESFEAFVQTHSQGDTDGIHTYLVEKDLPGTARYIRQFTEDHPTDLLIMGAKGHSKIERLLLGSTTEKLLQINKAVPCLVVK